jgi:hypothetical protein
MPAACGRGRWKLAANELLQAKVLLPLNCQMFVQGAENQKMFVQVVDAENRPALLQQLLSSLNRQRFVLGFDAENRPAIFPLVPLNIFACGQSASTVSECGLSQVPLQ